MAITTPSLKSPATWLEIGLTCHRQEATVELFITFTNSTSTAQELTFSNQTRKAELLGLHILTQTGQRVMPTHNLVIKPTQPAPNSILLAAGACFTYTLSGTLTEYGLEFPGARFELQLGDAYHAQFQYAGQKSNLVTLLR